MASTRDIDSMDFAFENSFHDSMEGFYAPAEAAKPSAPKLLIFNHALAERIGIEVADVADDDLARIFSGEEMPEGADPRALAYAGPQFGHFSPPLGDGQIGMARDRGRVCNSG